MSSGSATPLVVDQHARRRDYQALVSRLRDLIHRSVPPGTNVVVVSKGDPELVSLVGRQGWHFPQDDSGGYAGYHPLDSAAAIKGLEGLRSRGADFLVLPAVFRWWLDHYADFAAHLQHNYETLVEQPDTGTIYRLTLAEPRPTDHSTESREHDLENHRFGLQTQQIVDLAQHLLPAGQAVVVVDRRSAHPVHLHGRPTTHLYPSEVGDESQSRGTVARLESLLCDGGYLVVTQRAFDWWRTDDVVRAHVEQHYRCITQQTHVCSIYEVNAGEETVGP